MDNAYYTQEAHGPFELFELGDFPLVKGGTLRKARLAYRTLGRLNEAKSNAILFATWFSGTGKILQDVYIGRQHALDPEIYFIVVVEQFGDGLSTSPHNAEAEQRGSAFPALDIADDVIAQRRLLQDRFGIERLALVVGASMGAQQTYEWAVRYPDAVARAAPIAGTAAIQPYNRLYTDLLIGSLEDELQKGTEFAAAGLRRHAHLWALMGWSSDFYKQGRPAALGFKTLESFLSDFMEGYFGPMDPYNLICMARKWQSANLGGHSDGSVRNALARISATTCVIALQDDLFFPPRDCADDAAMISSASFEVVGSADGHLALFGADPGFMPQLDLLLERLLAMD